MKIVLAPNALKGSLSASAAASAMERGIRRILPEAEVVSIPVADGGDGLTDVFLHALHGTEVQRTVTGPLWSDVESSFCLVPERKMAAIEMATASGLALLSPESRNPTLTTTYGTGQLIAEALRMGAREITIGIGGSATNDGGTGMAAALGIRFLDAQGSEVKPIGGNLTRIRQIDASRLLPEVAEATIEAACDVDNPLVGSRGATRVYGPQKGATAEQIEELEAGLENLAACIQACYGIDTRNLPGAGAAGGLGAGLLAFLGAKLRRGIDLVFAAVQLEERMRGASLVFTAEGQIDYQTRFGKAPAGVAELAKKQGIPCIAIAGSVGKGIEELHETGISAVFTLCPGPISLQDAMNNGAEYIEQVAAQSLRLFLAAHT